MNRIDVYFTPAEAARADLTERQIVVIDVLRSCTTIATALRNGAAKIIPVESVEGALQLSGTLDPKTRLLCGERQGKMVGGFDLGNSPREYARARVEGATLVFASTNASPLIAGALNGLPQRLLGYVNVGAVAASLAADGKDVAVVCAGAQGGFSLEDAACAGALVSRVVAGAPGARLNDAAESALAFDRAHGADPEGVLRRSEHGRYLIELGFEGDIPVCARIDSVPVVPVVREGRILGAT